MGLEHFGGGGMWIFPGLICIIMMVVCYFVFVRGGIRPPWSSGDRGNQGGSADSESALEILEKRYARGEITQEELEQMKKNILS